VLESPIKDDDDELFLWQLPSFSDSLIQEVADKLADTLRSAKQAHLTCTEVLLPCQLLQRIAIDMLETADSEPCGIRGCNITIEFSDELGSVRRIAELKTDPNTVSTFDLRLTLKQDRSGWKAILPQFLM